MVPDKLYRGNSKFALGSSDGGPGVWSNKDGLGRLINRTDKEGRPDYFYQREVTRAPPNVEYLVGGTLFDGVDVGRRVLIDAKRYEPGNILTKNVPEVVRKGFINNVLDEARGQLSAANRTGFGVEWHVSGRAEADALRALFASKGVDIAIVWTPRIGG